MKSVGKWSWRIFRFVVFAAIVGALVYWIKFAPVAVTGHELQRGEMASEVMGTGTLEARIEATVSSKISGRIAALLIDQGERVESGQVLVRLDDDELKQQVAIAEANREAAEAAIVRLKTDKDRATAVFEQARTNRTRLEALLASNATSREDVDRATESLAVAQAGFSRAEAAITEGQKELVAAEKTWEYHRARLTDTQIVAPFAGLIVRRHRDPGDVVLPGTSILTLISTDELWISAWVDETEMSALHESQAARVIFRSESDRSFPGQVARLGKEVDRETREFVVDVRVLELPDNWAVGQRAEVYVETAHGDSLLLLPSQFVLWRDGQPGAFVDQSGQARWRVLQLGIRGRETVEVVEGLQPGEIVVLPVDRRRTLRDGQRIKL